MKKNKVPKKQSSMIDADRAASEAFAEDKAISVGELRAIRGAEQAPSLAAARQKKKETRKPRCRKKAEPKDGGDGAGGGGNGGAAINPLAGLAKPAIAASQLKQRERKRREVTFASPSDANPTRKKKDLKPTPAAAKPAGAKRAAATAETVETPGKAAAVVARPDDTPAETEMLESDSDNSNGAFFAGVDKTITNFCA